MPVSIPSFNHAEAVKLLDAHMLAHQDTDGIQLVVDSFASMAVHQASDTACRSTPAVDLLSHL